MRAVLFTIVFLVCCTYSFAQSFTACTPDCTDDDWSDLHSVGIISASACSQPITFRVYFVFRWACNQYYDFQIVGITPPNNVWPQFCDLNRVIAEMMFKLIHEGHLQYVSGFPPNDIGDCQTTYRATLGGCWHVGLDVTSNANIVHCDEDPSCCLTPMRVCLQVDGTFSVEPTAPWSVIGPPPACPEIDDEDPVTPDECRNVCGWYIYIPEFVAN